MKQILIMLFAAVMIYGSLAFANPQQINYQGQLTSPTGAPLDTTVALTFRLYTDSTSGSVVWTETRPSVTVARGLFNVKLGQGVTLPDSIMNQPEVWLGITVGSDTEMAPRTRIVSTAYSYRVGTVDGATGGTVTGDIAVIGKGNIGINNTNPGVVAIAEGSNNAARGNNSTISGGYQSIADSSYSTVSGGFGNLAGNLAAVVSGGAANFARGAYSTVAGGGGVSQADSNSASGDYSVIGGGAGNVASGFVATVAGGSRQIASGQRATIGGGRLNRARGDFSTIAGGGGGNPLDSNAIGIIGGYSFIGGGHANVINGPESALAGGYANRVASHGFVGGGYFNQADGNYANVVGGITGHAIGDFSFIGAGRSNSVDDTGSVVVGGDSNHVTGIYSFIGGGKHNTADNLASFIGGGQLNLASDGGAVCGGMQNNADSSGAFIGGGQANTASGLSSGVVAGTANIASGLSSVVGGGSVNRARGTYSFIGGGGGGLASDSNFASGVSAAVVGGAHQRATGLYSFAGGGYNNTASNSYAAVGGGVNNTASGLYSSIPGGHNISCSGNSSFVCGNSVTMTADSSFLFSDGTYPGSVGSAGNRRFIVIASGGSVIYSSSNVSTGVTLAAGSGAWASVSDSTKKENFHPVNTADVLDRVAKLKIAEWNYKTQDPRIRHMGPTAQDFYAQFQLGESDTTITTVDPDGVALAAIQELVKENEDLRTAVSGYRNDVNDLRSQLQTLWADKQQSSRVDEKGNPR